MQLSELLSERRRIEADEIPELRDSKPVVHEESQSRYEEISANAALTLIAVVSAFLDRQLQAQAEAFSRDGGFTERLYRHRRAIREKH